MTDSTASHRRTLRWGLTASSAIIAAMVLVPATPAAAHHGWDGFDTDRLVYVAGTVSSDGSWGEPHSYFDVNVDDDLPADTPELTIPEELQDPGDSVRVNAAIAYAGPEEELEVIIAPPAWSGRWGLDRALAVGERFQAVGYMNRTEVGMFRPVVFWYGEDETPVNQVLGNTLPVRAPLPGATPDEAPAPSSTSTAPDPLEMSAPSSEESAAPVDEAAASSEEAGVGAWGVWTAFGVVVVAAGVIGFLYVRRRTRQS